MSDFEEAVRLGYNTASKCGEASQQDYWRKFYEYQWGARRDFLANLIKDGEKSGFRAIKLLEAVERKNIFMQKTLMYENGDIELISAGLNSSVSYYEGKDALPCGTPAFKKSSLRGHELFIPYHAKTEYLDFLIDFIDARGPFDAIVELGCGFAHNLIGLHYHGGPTGIPYRGGEITDSGRDLAMMLAKLEPEIDLAIFPFDHLRPDLSSLPKVERLFVFTSHTIEQVEAIDLRLIETIAQAAPSVCVVHLEPFGFQAANLGPVSQAHAEMMEKNKWNRNLYAVLREAEAKGMIKLDFVATEIFLPTNPKNPTSLAVWRNR
jgi:hypothetical protein